METIKHDFSNWSTIEPAKTNRFLILMEGISIPPYLFRNYKLYNNGKDLIFETIFMESINFAFNPKDFFEITNIKLQYLDPIGTVFNELSFDVKGSNFEKIGDYYLDEIQTNKLKFIVDVKTLNLKYIN